MTLYNYLAEVVYSAKEGTILSEQEGTIQRHRNLRVSLISKVS